jgi:hypothetical protein
MAPIMRSRSTSITGRYHHPSAMSAASENFTRRRAGRKARQRQHERRNRQPQPGCYLLDESVGREEHAFRAPPGLQLGLLDEV